MAIICVTCIAFTLTACGETPPTDPPPVEKYSITFTSEDTVKGTVSAKDASDNVIKSGDEVEKGTQITLSATANTGYSFAGWFVSDTKVSTQVEYTLTINGDTTLTAKFNVNSYTLSYSSSDTLKGSVSSSIQSNTVDYGTSVTLTATPKAGYKLNGWYVGNDKVSSELVYTFTMPANDYTVQARFDVDSFNFSFSAETGKGTVVCLQQLGQKVEFGTEISLEATANEGYTFEGWYVNNEKIADAGARYTFTMRAYDCVLQAKFTTNSYTLKYVVNDTDMGTIINAPTNDSLISFGTAISLTAQANQGYEFEGWYENGSLKGANLIYSDTMPARALNLEARFKPKKFSLLYTINNQNLGKIEGQPQSNQIDYNTDITLEAIPLNEGYQFDGWYVNGEFSSADVVYSGKITSDLSIEARFSIKKFTLNYSVDYKTRGSINSLTSTNSLVAYGEEVTLTAVPNSGYYFAGWYEDGTKVAGANETYTFPMKSYNYTVQARFGVYSYSLKFSSNDENMGTVSARSENKPINSNQFIDYNKEVTLIATEKQGYVFEGWYKDGQFKSSNKQYTFNMESQDLAFTAKFKKAEYNFSCSTEDRLKGEVTSSISNGKAEYNASITVKAQEKTGYDFDGWYVGNEKILDAPAQYTFQMPASDLELVAVFKPEKRTVQFKDGNDVVYTATVDYNTPVSKYNYNKSGYTFEGWFTDKELSNPYDFNAKVTQKTELYAKMIKDKVYFEIRYLDEDGITLISTQEVEEGTTATFVQNLKDKTGYEFKGWEYFDTSTNTYVKFDSTVVINKDLDVIAIYEAITLKVKLYRENVKVEQNLITTIDVKYNEKPNKPDNPPKEGFLFVKWVYLDNQNAEFDFNQKLTKNVDLLAIWIEKPAETFKVTFYYEFDNPIEISAYEVEKDGTVGLPNDQEKEGWTFVGWIYKDADGKFKEFNDSIAVTKNLDVYGKFEINTFKVVFKDYDGTELKAEQTVEYGSSAVAPSDPIRTGYDFYAWDTEFDEVTKDLVVTATYKIITFTVTFYDVEDETELYKYEDVEYGSKISVPETPDKAGFVGWFTTETFENEFNFNETKITSDVTIYAKFEVEVIIYHQVTFYNYDGEDYVVYITQSVEDGKTASDIGKLDLEGYTFTGWAYEQTENNLVKFDFTTAITKDLQLYAQYQIKTFAVIFRDYDGREIERQTVGYGSSAEAPSVPTRTGYDFNGWDIEFDEVSEDLIITATYKIQTFTVTFMADGKVVATQLIEYGKAINYITATKAGHVFKYWYLTDENKEYVKTESVTYDLTLYAKFEPYNDTSVYTVEYKFDDGTGFVTLTIQTVEKGNTVTQLPDYEDGSGKNYDWCYLDESEGAFKPFEFSTPITADLTLYAWEVE